MNIHNPPQNPASPGGNGTGRRNKPRRTPKGRQVDPIALSDIQALLGDASVKRDLLIEYLHLIQDKYGHISASHMAALAHVIGNKVEAAYARGDLLERRRELMEAWADFSDSDKHRKVFSLRR